jgi:hypothetical protein
MIRRFREAFGPGADDEAAEAAVRRGLDNVLTALDNVIDDNAALARVYASAGQSVPAAPPAGHHGGTAASQVCARIGMLELAISTALKAQPRAAFQGTFSLQTARKYLFELRDGLERRTLAEQDAFRLLFITRHTLHEAEMALGREHRLPLPQLVLTQIADFRQLSTDLLSQLDGIQDEVMRLFGHSGDSSPVLVPQH